MATTDEANAFLCPSMAPDADSRRAPRKRTLTEARREQNRLNQRRYRQKQRTAQRLQGSQHQSQSSLVQDLELRSRPTSRGLGDTTTSRDASHVLRNTQPASSIHAEQCQQERASLSPQNDAPILQDHLHLPSLSSNSLFQPFQQIINLENITKQPPAGPTTSSPPVSGAYCNVASIPAALEFSSPGLSGDLPSDWLSTSSRTITIAGQDDPSPNALEFLAPEGSGAAAQNWRVDYDIPPLPLTLPSDITSELRPGDDLGSENVQDDTMAQVFDLERIITAGVEVLFGGRERPNISKTASFSPRLPNPWEESIQFTRTSMVLACFHNARSLGLRVQDVMMLQCHASSPFYRPLTPADDPKKCLRDVTNPSTPAHLKPTLPQLLYPHLAFMDLIPIPVFRARAITLAATQPHLINIMELKKDVSIENGLSYWSSTSGGASPSASARREGHGQPWDMRSWEAAPWFLRKWRMLFGGEEEEIWRQSLWWQSARGGTVSDHLT